MQRFILIAVLSMCATTALEAQRGRRGCEKTPVDSTIAGAPIYRACHVDQAARPAGRQPVPDFIPVSSEIRDGACFRANYEFVVSALGVPEVASIRQVSATNARHAAAVEAIIPLMRYRPAYLNGVAVRQVVEYRHNGTVRTIPSQSPTSIGGAGVGGMRVARC